MAAGARAAPPEPVSPGTSAGIVTIASTCPTFSFAPSLEARGHRIAVYRAEEDEQVGREPILGIDLPGLAASWTPPIGRCLEAGRIYAWAVAALPDESGARPGWSEVRLFRVLGDPSGGEGTDAIEPPGDPDGGRARSLGRRSAPRHQPFAIHPGASLGATEPPAAGPAAAAPQLAAGLLIDNLPSSFGVRGELGIEVPADQGGGTAGIVVNFHDANETAVTVTHTAVSGRALYVEGPTALSARATNDTGLAGRFSSATGFGVEIETDEWDLMLSGSSDSEDDGKLTSDPFDSDSDLILNSYDEIELIIDSDDNEPQDDAQLKLKAGTQTIFRVHKSGNVYADGGYHCGNSINNGSDNIFDEPELDPCLADNMPADFAEMLPAGSAALEPADLLALRPDGRLVRSSRAHQTAVAGVVSTRPSYLGNSRYRDAEGWVPVALVGIVPVKATAANGPIRPGDLLAASDRRGHAMRARADAPPGSVVGKALESLDEGQGRIRMLVLNR